MNPERARQLEGLYHQALGHAPGDRAAFLAEACAGDEDLRREIESLLAEDRHADSFMTGPAIGGQASIPREKRHWRGIAAVLAIILVSVLAGIVFVKTHQKDLAAEEVRFEVPIPNSTFASFSVSPDGRYIVYTTPTNGKDALWVREINSLNARPLPGTEGARIPDWAADGTIVFAGAHDVMTIEVTGRNRKTIAPLVGFEYRRSTTNRDGVTIFANSVLRRVDANGGPPQAITQLDKSLYETFHSTPWFLPDGRHFLYLVGSTNPENRAIYVGSLDSTMKKRLMSSESKALYMPPGFLLYLDGPVLMARPFDADRLEFTGEPLAVADDVASVENSGPSAFYASAAGILIYQTRAGRTDRQLMWMDRSGKTIPPLGQAAATGHVRLSPEGGRIAYPIGEVNRDADIWIHDVERNLPTRVTAQHGGKRYPVWSPDGSRLVFGSNQGIPRAWSLREKASNGTGEEKVLLEAELGFAVLPDDWSADGGYIIFEKYRDGTQGRGDSSRQGSIGSLWILPLQSDSKPIAYLSDQFDRGQAVLSPNGRWLAYVSNESGTYQIFVQSFPNPSEGKWQISTEGGMAPHWKRGGREIYYLDPSRRIVAVPVVAGSSFAAQKPEPLFTTAAPFPPYPNALPYDAAADGQRFLIAAPLIDPALARLMVVLNWTNAIERKQER